MTWLGKAVLYIIYVAGLVALSTAIILSLRNTPVTRKPTVITQQAPAKKPQQQPSSPSSAGSSVAQSGGSASTQLSNTGPGDVVAVFVGTSILATLLHRRYLTR